MLIWRMDSKRERRPNVRLGEVGDFPAAFACVFSHRYEANSIRKRRNRGYAGLGEPGKRSFPKETPPESLDLDRAGSPGIMVDPLQSRENENPTSEEESLGGGMGMIKSELNFGTVTRKCRVMKRRCRSAAGSNRVFASGWGFTYSPEIADESDGKVSAGFPRSCFAPDESNDLSGRETSMTSKEGADDGNVCPNAGRDAGHGHGDELSSVRGWLEGMGLGKYADMFEMHEVDEEVLPLLTLQDLKEMGLHAVGPRRKLYSAIKQLAGDSPRR